MAPKFDNNTPIYLQLVEEIKIDIISGKLKSGDRLPSVREFALMMKVNPNTMQKALVELEELKLVYTERTNGKFVTEDKKLIDKFKKHYADELIKNFILNMRSLGFNNNEVIDYLEKMEGEE